MMNMPAMIKTRLNGLIPLSSLHLAITTDSDIPSTENNFNVTSPLQDIVIDNQYVYEGLCNLDVTKATGIDGLNPKIFKNCASSLPTATNLSFVFNLHEICDDSSSMERPLYYTCLQIRGQNFS